MLCLVVCLCVCLCVCLGVCLCVCVLECIVQVESSSHTAKLLIALRYTHTPTNGHTHWHTHTHTHTDTHIHWHTLIYTHTHTHIHKHTQTKSSVSTRRMEINCFFLSEDLLRSILHSFFRRSPVRNKYVWRDTFMSVPRLVTVIYGRMATRGGFMSVSVCVCACVCTYLCAMPTPLMPCQLKHEVTVKKAKFEKLRKRNSKNRTVFENVCCVKRLA